MRVRLTQLEIAGADRRVDFTPGLNIITGPITTGKTTLLRLCRVLLGTGIEPGTYPREVRDTVRAISGRLLLGDKTFGIVRPFVSTTTAKVDIAWEGGALRLPALQPDETADTTFARWLLTELGLPELRVPSAPTLPESTPTPVTISDYLAYCVLPQDEIDNMVFGHRDPFKNIKRRYVFQIVYGLYDVQMAALQEELRDVLAEIRQIKSQTSAFERFLTNTPWENRAALAREREDTRRELTSLESQVVESAERAAISDRALDLRRQIAGLERDRASAASEQEFERQSIDQLTRLLGQLEGQSSRLTRAIVAGELLVDFEFRICPRCGTPIELQRASEQVCPLCLQTPNPSAVDRDVLVGEQDRLGLQIQETRELIAEHHVALREIDSRLTALNRTRMAIAEELDYQTRAYVSDAASALTHAAEKRAELESTITRLEDYEKLFFKLDEALSDLLTLDSRRGEIEAALEVAKSRQFSAEGRIGRLEDEMERALEAFEAPRFADPPTSAVNRQNFLPVVDGRSFDELSSQGLQVLVNVAHALAHQQTAFGLGLMLPNILFIDGLTSNIGHEGLDLERVNHVYDYLIALSQSLGNEIQIIVADNDVPVQAHSYVRVRFDESERLIRRAS